MNDQAIVLHKLTPSIGAEITGIDLRGPLNEIELQALSSALIENLVIFFRDQNLAPAEHKAFDPRFGTLHIHPAPLGRVNGRPRSHHRRGARKFRAHRGRDVAF
jgi:alpha-ketoglutarate-dependent taurine dioxygenase